MGYDYLKDEEILTVDVGRGNKILVKKSTNTKSGAVKAAIREMYTDEATGEVKYGKNGIGIISEVLPSIISALVQCLEADERTDLALDLYKKYCDDGFGDNAEESDEENEDYYAEDEIPE